MRWLCCVIVGLMAPQAGVAGDPFQILTPPDERTTGLTITREGNSPVLVWCPSGTFLMGSPETEEFRQDDEKQVRVTLTQGFWIGRDEVTQRQWQSVMGTAPWRDHKSIEGKPIPDQEHAPAIFIAWQEAMTFCEELTKQERKAGRLAAGWKYTLPTEAQWEYACRAGTKTAWSFGDSFTTPKLHSTIGNLHAWYSSNVLYRGDFVEETMVNVFEDSVELIQPHAQKVRQKKPNPWGIHDLHGNVFEWCLDWYVPELPGGKDPVVKDKPIEKTDAVSFGHLSLHSTKVVVKSLSKKKIDFAYESSRVIRGGSFRSPFGSTRSTSRNALIPSVRADYYGFRVVLVPEKP